MIVKPLDPYHSLNSKQNENIFLKSHYRGESFGNCLPLVSASHLSSQHQAEMSRRSSNSMSREVRSIHSLEFSSRQ